MSENVAFVQEAMRRAREDPVFFAKAFLGVVPHPGQARWLRDANASINVLVPGNRWGKSFVTAARHAHFAFTKRGLSGVRDLQDWMEAPYQTISAGMSADQANIVFRAIERMFRSPQMAPFVKRFRTTPFPHVVLYNNAIIHCRSAHDGGKYLDGSRYDLVSVDEAGYIPDLKQLMNSVILMRAAGGGIVDLVGTPKGISNQGLWYYWERANRGVPGYFGMRGSSTENVYLPRADIEMRAKLLANADPRMRAQVIDGEFVDLAGLAFTNDQRAQLFDPALPPEQPYREGHRYLQTWDLGRRTDYTVGTTWDITTKPYVLVRFDRLNKTSWESIYTLIGERAREYRVAEPRIDATGVGDVVEEELWKRGIRVEGFKISTGAIKTNLINALQTALDEGRRVVGEYEVEGEGGFIQRVPVQESPGEGEWGLLRSPPIPEIVDEFGVYSIDDKDIRNDVVMAFALFADMVVNGMAPEPVLGGLYSG